MPTPKRRYIKVVLLSVVGFVVTFALLLALSHPLRRNIRITYESLLAKSQDTPNSAFPSVPTTGMSVLQRKIITLTKQEYDKKPVSFDSNVLKYSQNTKEAWCANFVSWIVKESDHPFVNPNSGSWRIPGVNTLQEYFQSTGNYHRAGEYKPKVGDVAIYLKNRSHTNIVIAVTSDQMTTVGGNENGHIKINTQKYQYGSEGLSGFGSLQ